MTITDSLRNDHEILRNIIGLLRSGETETVSYFDRERLFEGFTELLQSVNSAEEVAVLDRVSSVASLRSLALRFEEEKDLIERLVARVENARDHERWAAGVEVLCDALERHLDAEDEKLLPALAKSLAAERAQELAQHYDEIRKEALASSPFETNQIISSVAGVVVAV